MFIKNNKNNDVGFTLLEMSIVVLILGILLVGGINLHLAIIELSEKNLSSDRIYMVDKAIREYVLKNLHLPCPSDILLSETDADYKENFGKELRDIDDECFAKNGDFKNNNYIAGGVPTKVLELPSEYAEDAWGNRIVYVVDKKYAKNKIGFFASGGDSINIKGIHDTDENVVTSSAIYVLISSGQNGNGAFRDGKQNDIDAGLYDAKNIIAAKEYTSYDPLNPNSSTNNNPVFIKDTVFIKDINNKNFDDIVYYRDKNSLIFELGLEDSPCSLNELYDVDNKYPNGNDNNGIRIQGAEVYRTVECGDDMISENPNIESSSEEYKPLRRCQKYGQWSNEMYECIRGCGKAKIYTFTDASNGFPNPGDLLNSIEKVEYLDRVPANANITLDCKDKYGYIKLKCEDKDGELEWKIEEVNCIDI